MIENVRGLLNPRFDVFRQAYIASLDQLGYHAEWRLLNASNFGVPQLRPRLIFVALKKQIWRYFAWPEPIFNDRRRSAKRLAI